MNRFLLVRVVVALVCALSMYGQDALQRLEGSSGAARLAILLELTRFPDPVSTPRMIPDERRLPLVQEAVALARQLGDRSGEARALHQMGLAHSLARNFTLALEMETHALEVYTKIQDLDGISALELEIGSLYMMHFVDYFKALEYFKRALETSTKAGIIHRIINAHRYIGDVYFHMGNYQLASLNLIEALKFGENLKDYQNINAIGVVYIKLSQVYAEMGDFGSALSELEHAREIFDREGHYRGFGLSRVDMQRGEIFRLQGRFEEARDAFLKTLAYRRALGHSTDLALLYHLLGETEREAGRLPQALEHYRRALELWREKAELRGAAETQLGIGLTLLRQGDPDRALPDLLQCLETSRSKGYQKALVGAYLALSELHAAKGDPQKALDFRRLHEATKAKVQSPKILAEVLGIKHQYDQTRQDRLLDALRRQRVKILLGYGVLVATLVVALLMVRANLRRIRTWASKTLRQRQEAVLRHRTLAETLRARLDELETDRAKPRYVSSHLTEEQAQITLRKLQVLMEQQHLYRDSELTLATLAQKVHLNMNYLSRILNQHLNKKFGDYVNEYRIAECKRLLADPAQAGRSALDIGLDAGFNAKSSYYRLFKEATGLTPVEFRKAVLQRKASEPGDPPVDSQPLPSTVEGAEDGAPTSPAP